MKIKIAKVTFEPLIYPRRLNSETQEPFYIHVRRYARSMKAGEHFPPIVVAKIKDKTLLIDGYHRLLAAKSLDKTEIEADEIACKNYDEAFVEAIKRNKRHGAPLDEYEIALAVDKLQKQKRSIQEISDIVSIPMQELQKLIADRIVPTAGGTLVLKRMFVGRPAAATLTEETQKPYSAASQVKLIREVNKLLEDDFIDIDSADVLKELEKLSKLLKKLMLKGDDK